ncbi:phosphatase [Synergistales bacterium]|nr:phosphatase [Synergistales bacterium]
MIKIDLHLHSIHSDGTCTVDEIVDGAASRGVSVLALTDHDTTEGIDAFARACERRSIRHISGIELSSKWAYTAHILGYRFLRIDPLKEALNTVIEQRNDRNRIICEKLRELGIDIKIEEAEKEAGGQVIGRPHIASVLLKKGVVPDMPSAFSKYLAKGAPAYVARGGYSPFECVRIIKEAGGLPVLAHPSLTKLGADELEEFLEELKAHGLWGLECISSHCSSEEALTYLGIAAKHSLFPTAGSDFHGKRRESVKMGVQVSETFLPWARLGVSL